MALMFPPAALRRLRKFSEENMREWAQRQVRETTASGADVTVTYADSGDRVKCRIAPIGVREGVVGAQEEGRGDWRLVLPANTEAALTDRWVVTDRAATWSLTLEVVGIRAPRSNEMQRELTCLERQVTA